MKPETIAMLCNPYNHEPLRLVILKNSNGGEEYYLESVDSKEKFFFHNGIPVLFNASLLNDFNLYYNSFYRKVAKFYDPALKILSIFAGGREINFRNHFLELLEIGSGSKVLEVSVGTGKNISYLPGDADYFGLDLSWEMLSQCQQNLRKSKQELELFYGNAEVLPFQDNMFDVVFHVGGINAFNHRAKAINEMIRVTKSGTRIIIVDETSRMMQKLNWIPSVKKMINEWGDRFETPEHLVPSGMHDVQTDLIINGFFYRLSFRKP